MAIEDKVREFKRDLTEIESSMEELKRQYDMYFAGVMRRQPFELKGKVDALFRRHRATDIAGKLELNFRFSTLQAKYSKYCELWEKILKRRETDPHAVSPYGPTREQLAAEMSAAMEERRKQRRQRHGKFIDDPVRCLYNDYVDAKKDLGETTDSLRYESFRRQIQKQVDAIKRRTGAKDVQFSVARKDGKVSLTAKVVKDE